jgi:hypothetical protein
MSYAATGRAHTAFALVLVSAACSEPLAPAQVAGFDDDFSGKELSADWTILNGDSFEHRLEGGRLHMRPTKNTVWYKKDQGPGLVKLVTGNFKVSSIVRARKASAPSEYVSNGYQFAGLIARDPASAKPDAKENYVFNVVGYRGDYLSVETKTTKRDHSDVEGPAWPTADAELRICRINDVFRVYKRPIGEKTWELGFTYERGDLPATLQVGPIAYTFTDQYDLDGSFEEIRFAPVRTVEDCTTD